MKGEVHHLSSEWSRGECWSVRQLNSDLYLVPNMIMNKNLLMEKQQRLSGLTVKAFHWVVYGLLPPSTTYKNSGT